MYNFEIELFRSINNLAGRFAAIDAAMLFFSNSYVWLGVAVVTFVGAVGIKNRKLVASILTAALALGLTDLVSFECVKPLVARERPCWLLEHVHLIPSGCGGSYGFTSNHAANAFAVWAIWCKIYGFKSPLTLCILIFSVIISLSRVYLGVHFVGDILGGAVLGTLIGNLLWSVGLFAWVQRLTNMHAIK